MSKSKNLSGVTEPALHIDGVTTYQVGPKAKRASGPVPAFVGLAQHFGGVYAEQLDGMTIDRALEAARLNFTVQFGTSQTTIKLPARIDATGVTPEQEVTLPDGKWRSTVAVWHDGFEGPDGRAAVLGKVRSHYQLCQPHEAGEFGQAVLDEGGANLAAVGGYGDPFGARMYLAFKLPDRVLIGGQDPHDVWFTVLNSFDGGGFSCMFAPIRLACTNQTTMKLGRRAQRVSLRHTGQFAHKLADVRAALGLTFAWVAEWEHACRQLLDTPMNADQLRAFAEIMLPTPDTIKTQQGVDNWRARRRQLVTVAEQHDSNAFGRGTAYAAYQAVTYLTDHGHNGEPHKRWADLADGAARVESIKTRAAQLLLAR